MKWHLVRLQLTFEAPKDVKLEMLSRRAALSAKWQHIAIIAAFSSSFFFFHPLLFEVAERNSTISGHMVGS